jgi:hypothetical protein
MNLLKEVQAASKDYVPPLYALSYTVLHLVQACLNVPADLGSEGKLSVVDLLDACLQNMEFWRLAFKANVAGRR